VQIMAETHGSWILNRHPPGGCCLACDPGRHPMFGVPRADGRDGAISAAGKATRKQMEMR
jgi:hypothetical protein